jgi:hypothetical protein
MQHHMDELYLPLATGILDPWLMNCIHCVAVAVAAGWLVRTKRRKVHDAEVKIQSKIFLKKQSKIKESERTFLRPHQIHGRSHCSSRNGPCCPTMLPTDGPTSAA